MSKLAMVEAGMREAQRRKRQIEDQLSAVNSDINGLTGLLYEAYAEIAIGDPIDGAAYFLIESRSGKPVGGTFFYVEMKRFIESQLRGCDHVGYQVGLDGTQITLSFRDVVEFNYSVQRVM